MLTKTRFLISIFLATSIHAGIIRDVTLDANGEKHTLHFKFIHNDAVVIDAASPNAEIDGDAELTRIFAITTAPWLFAIEEIKETQSKSISEEAAITKEKLAQIRSNLEQMPNKEIMAKSVCLYTFEWMTGNRKFKAVASIPWADSVQLNSDGSLQSVRLLLFERVDDRWLATGYESSPVSSGLAFPSLDRLAMFLVAGGVWQPEASRIAVFYSPNPGAQFYKETMVKSLTGHQTSAINN